MRKLFLLFVISIVIFSCTSKKNGVVTPTQNINRVWMLVEFKEYKKEYFIEKKAFLDLTNSERATSKMGCNNLSFTYKTKKSEISFTNGISTEVACLDMKLESDFSKEIIKMNSFYINAHKLTLTSASGEKMIFVAQDWD